MNTQLIAALIIAGVLAIAVVGLVVAQVASTTSSPNGAATGKANVGFFGLMGRMMGSRSMQFYGTSSSSSTGYPAQIGQPVNITVTDPNTGTTTTYQGYYEYGCGGMMGFRP